MLVAWYYASSTTIREASVPWNIFIVAGVIALLVVIALLPTIFRLRRRDKNAALVK